MNRLHAQSKTRYRDLPSFRRAFTLVELLVVIAIIGILIGLLMPAVQAAREAARRMQCQNHLHQMGIALQNYHDLMGQMPAGMAWGTKVQSNGLNGGMFWSGALLPFVEQQPLYDSMSPIGDWDIPGTGNYFAQQKSMSLYRCPTASTDSRVDHGIPDRVPGTYLACASGTVASESDPAGNIGLGPQNGVMFRSSKIGFNAILDGLSSTIAVGETLYITKYSGPDFTGIPQLVDHWSIGSCTLGANEYSEGLGSTAAPINASRSRNTTLPIEQRELCFASYHQGGVLVLYCDSHVKFLTENIDMTVYRAMGTRDGDEVIELQ